jgi:NNP family nitrate/nitrite transporter-like MFS transporter
MFIRRNPLDTETSKQNNRWYILLLAVITYIFIAGMTRLSMVVLFDEISIDLSLSKVDIGAIWGMDPLAGVFISLLGGLIADRFGVRKTMAVVCFLAGIIGAARGLAGDFSTIAISMFIFGLVSTMIPTVLPKVTAVWFSGRYIALTNAFLYIAMSLGGMIGTMFSATTFSPLLGGWRNLLFIYGIPAIIISMLWFFTVRETKGNELSSVGTAPVKFKESLSHVIRIRDIWLLGLVMLSQIGTMMGITGYLPLYLRDIGWSTMGADSAVTMVIGLSCLSTIPVIMISSRLKSHKTMLILSVIITSLSMGLFFLFDGIIFWILLAIYSLLRIVPLSLVNTLIIETKGVGGRYAGTAIGLSNTLGMLGGFFFPPLGNSLDAILPGLPFIFWAAMCLITLIGLFFTTKQSHYDIIQQI